MPTQKGKTPAFFKTPLTYVFIIFGTAIGNKVGSALNPGTPGQAGLYVVISIVICDVIAAFIGYSTSVGIDSMVDRKVVRVLLKLIAATIGFFVYCFVLAAIPY